jgi:NDP-sugar pyrophosphorylase family protein
MEEFDPATYFDLSSFKHAALFCDIKQVWDVIPKISAYLNEQELGQILTEIPQGAHIVNPHQISIGKGSIIEPGAYIKGPCILGDHCIIRQGAYIRGDFICGNHCVIGHDTEVKNTLFLDKAHAAHFAYLGDSVLGNGVNLGAGTKCANLKLDKSPVVVYVNGRRFSTGLRKMGAILGDGVQTGCNSVLNPGTLMGKNSICYPCVNLGGIIPADKCVKNSATLILSPR